MNLPGSPDEFHLFIFYNQNLPGNPSEFHTTILPINQQLKLKHRREKMTDSNLSSIEGENNHVEFYTCMHFQTICHLFCNLTCGVQRVGYAWEALLTTRTQESSTHHTSNHASGGLISTPVELVANRASYEVESELLQLSLQQENTM